MPVDTKLNNLVMNKLTTAQYEQLVENGQVNDNELYLTTDANYPTQQDMETALATKQDVLTAGSGISISNNVISADISTVNWSDINDKPTFADVATSGDYNDLVNKPVNVSEFSNDANYVTESQLETKQDTLVSGTNIKTINNQSLLGSGNIEIQGGSGGGSNIIEITQAEYDALTAYTEGAMYVITDAQAINMDNYATTGDIQAALDSYYTSAQTDSAISNAVSGKADKVSVDSNEFECLFPTWNNQGCITGVYRTAYLSAQNINDFNKEVYSDSSFPLPSIYAPTSAGSAGQPLLSNGSGAPVWGAYKFQFISQSQYDALATKDSTTIYFIVNES